MADNKKYWLKLDKDFLKSPQMKVIRGMENGKDYIIFYLSLMLESIETVGHLRFTSLVPYNSKMLSSITDTNIDVVEKAIKIFCELGLMQIFDDGTIFMTEVPKITGKESESAERVRKYRLKQKELEMLQCNTDVTKCNNNKDKEINKNKNINKNKYIYNKYGKYQRIKLTEKEYLKLVDEFGEDFINKQIELLDEYVESNNNKNKYSNFNLVLRKSIRENWFKKKETTQERIDRLIKEAEMEEENDQSRNT